MLWPWVCKFLPGLTFDSFGHVPKQELLDHSSTLDSNSEAFHSGCAILHPTSVRGTPVFCLLAAFAFCFGLARASLPNAYASISLCLFFLK